MPFFPADTKSESLSAATQNSSLIMRILWAALIVCILVGGFYFAQQSGPSPDSYGNDFNVYYHASREILEGRDPFQHSLGEWTPYLYPPLLAELLVPLAVLPLPIASYLWFCISAACAVIAITLSTSLAGAVLRNDSRNYSSYQARKIAVAFCSFLIIIRFVFDNFNLGQVNLVVTVLVVAHVYFFRRGRSILSVFALTLAISIKLTPVLLLVFHLTKLRIKYFLACVGLLFVLTGASFAVFGSGAPSTFKIFVSRTLQNGQGFNLEDPGNQSLRGVVGRVASGNTSGDDARVTVTALSFAVSAVVLCLAIGVGIRTSDEVQGIAPMICCLVLLSPLSWKAHFVILILPITVVATRFWVSTGIARAGLLSILLGVFLLFNVTSPRLIGEVAAHWSDEHSLVSIGAMLILATTVVVASKFGKASRVC